MQFRLLQKTDVDKLFQFELDNRYWLERHIEARNNEFYSKFKVEKHIKLCISEYRSQVMYPMLIESDNQIIARVNLRNIDMLTKSADLGYRVAEKHSGKGIASFAVAEMLECSKAELGIETIRAFVSVTNVASQRVLDKYSFMQVRRLKDFVVVSGKTEDCFEYQLSV